MRESGHTLDWSNRPSPFKLYPDLPVVPLPRDFPPPATDTFAALSAGAGVAGPLSLERLASLLFYAAGVTKQKTYAGGERMYFRAAPSTGALYQTEVYVIAGDVEGLAPGVYHFGPGDFALRRLRAGDHRGALAGAAAEEDWAARPALLALTGIYWRNTWKYQARAYRHLFWDAGTMLSHLTVAATALAVDARVALGFVDAEVNGLLGLDAAREAALALVAVGGPGHPAPVPPPAAPIAPAVVPLSPSEVAYPLVAEAYADSSLSSEAEVIAWREAGAAMPAPPGPAGALLELPPPSPAAGRTLADTIVARGSTRQFSGESIPLAALSSALALAARGGGADDVPAGLVDLYLTVHAVDGLAAGVYAYHRGHHALEPLRAGDVRAEATGLCLGQPLGGTSSATVFFLANLARVLGALGNRGYRAVNLEAGAAGGRLYLAAYAQRFGATGLTFFDDDVVRFFSPHAQGKDAIFVTALGLSAARQPRQP